MMNNNVKTRKRLLEQEHILPYTLKIDEQPFKIFIYTKLGKVTGILITNAKTEKPATKDEAKKIATKLQKYNFYFEYLTKRMQIVKERDSGIAEKVEQLQIILNDTTIFSKTIQPAINQLGLALEIYKQQQYKMDIYQEDITLLNEKIKGQGEIYPEDWQHAEELSIAFAKAAYAQTIYLEANRENRRKLSRYYHNEHKSLPAEKRRELGKLVSLLSDTNAGLIFDQIISLQPMLEKGLMIDKEAPLAKQMQEFDKEYTAHCRFFKPNSDKVINLIRN